MIGRLLVLDDDPDVGKTICTIAGIGGFETLQTTTADAFFSAEQDWKPSHVALDLMMPGKDGVEVLETLARRRSMAKIVLTSGAGPRVLEAAHRASTLLGLNILGVVPKPFKAETLSNVLRTENSASYAASNKPNPPGGASGPEITETELAAAIKQNQLFLLYQPKIRCSSGRLIGHEALVRWLHPERGLISPADFIPLAESTGLIEPLTESVFTLALAALGRNPKLARTHLSVNISAQSLANPTLPEHLADRCLAQGVDPQNIILEITETAAMADPDATLNLTTRLRLKGFRLSIDDFGIGYSSLQQLARIPFSELKVDMSFVRAMTESAEARKIVAAVINLGHSLNMSVAAEGVEDKKTLDTLKFLQCDIAQGYYIGKPIAEQDLVNWEPPGDGDGKEPNKVNLK